MTVETIKQPMSDFAIKLSNALKSIGHHYFGKVDYDKINVEEYLKMSPREMALKYAQDHDLSTKKKLFDILKVIYAENKKDNFKISLRELADEKKLEYLLYSTAIVRFGLVERKGERIRTKYFWKGSAAPVFSDAENLYEFAEQMRLYKLDNKSLEYIENHIKDPLEEIMEKLNPEDSSLKYYQVTRVYRMKTTHHNAKERKLKQILEARKVMDREISRKMPDPDAATKPIQEQDQAQEQIQTNMEDNFQDINPQEISKSAVLPNQDETPDEGLLFLMAQRVKMYKKISKKKDKINEIQQKINEIQEKILRKYENKLKS